MKISQKRYAAFVRDMLIDCGMKSHIMKRGDVLTPECIFVTWNIPTFRFVFSIGVAPDFKGKPLKEGVGRWLFPEARPFLEGMQNWTP